MLYANHEVLCRIHLVWSVELQREQVALAWIESDVAVEHLCHCRLLNPVDNTV